MFRSLILTLALAAELIAAGPVLAANAASTAAIAEVTAPVPPAGASADAPVPDIDAGVGDGWG
jgi:hypothetical protein